LDRYLDSIEEKVKAIERDAWALGMTNAANAFQRYLSRTGGTVYFRPQDLRRYPVVQDAERGVQKHFLDWILHPKVERKVSVTRGGPVVQTVVSPWERLGEELTNLADGQTIARSSYWDRKFRYPPKLLLGLDTFTDTPEADGELFAFAGDAFLRGNGNLTFTRNGDDIDFEGFVHHKFDQPYDYEKGQTFYAPKTGGLIEGFWPHALTGEEAFSLRSMAAQSPSRCNQAGNSALPANYASIQVVGLFSIRNRSGPISILGDDGVGGGGAARRHHSW
jgi:hypothetical protein